MNFWFNFFCLVGLFMKHVESADPNFTVFPLGPSGLLVTWDPSTVDNAEISEFRCYYNAAKDEKVTEVFYSTKCTVGQYKIPYLKEDTSYKIAIQKHTKNIQLKTAEYEAKGTTGLKTNSTPAKPDFQYEIIKGRGSEINAYIRWLPCGKERNCQKKELGTHFIVKFKLLSSPETFKIPEVYTDHTTIRDLFAGKVYEFVVASVNGDFETDSDPQEILISPTSDPVKYGRVLPLNNQSLMLTWKAPEKSSAPIKEYRIAYSNPNSGVLVTDIGVPGRQASVDSKLDVLHTKISNLYYVANYTFYIIPMTELGIGTEYRIDFTPYNYDSKLQPAKPEFIYKIIYEQYPKLYIFWLPCGQTFDCQDKKPGSEFYVKYKSENDITYNYLLEEGNDYLVIYYAIPGKTYEVRVVSVDLETSIQTESDAKFIKIPQKDEFHTAVEVIQGKDVVIPCKAPLSAKPDIHWYIEGINITENDIISKTETGDLIIRNTSQFYQHEYSCEDKNYEAGKSYFTYLVVKYQTAIKRKTDFTIRPVSRGEKVKLVCTVEKDEFLAVEVKWYHNGTDIGGSLQNPIRPGLVFLEVWVVPDNTTLSNYTCVAKSYLDETSATVTLQT